jgi:shikimate dehydrogenase
MKRVEIVDFIKGHTKIYSVLGNPIEHSISPQIHNTLGSLLKNDMAYTAFKVEKNCLKEAVDGLKALNVKGFNVTIPFKKDIMKLTDENCKEAVMVGAVNTVKNHCGRLYGYNTDGEGFSRSFMEETGDVLKRKKIFIFGAGGAARSIAIKAAQDKAQEVYLHNRTKEKADDIAACINHNTSSKAFVCCYGQAKKEFEKCDIIVNTTSLGMHPDVESLPLVNDMDFKPGQTAYDIIYNPPMTRFLKMAQSRGCKAINGFGMLLYQAVYAYEIWNDIKVSDNIIKKLDVLLRNILPGV